tara:strand:+ start:148 stop:435 length:288 start_codon:yes stop_codon:yes gene_type:complete
MAETVTKLRKKQQSYKKREWTWESFVDAWQDSSSYEEVLEKMGLEDNAKERRFIGGKASYARKKGVPLKKFYRKHRFSNNHWDDLKIRAEQKNNK